MHLQLMDNTEETKLTTASGTRKPVHNLTADELVRLQESVTRTTKAILRAKEHVRGMKTRRYLDEAESNIQQALGRSTDRKR